MRSSGGCRRGQFSLQRIWRTTSSRRCQNSHAISVCRSSLCVGRTGPLLARRASWVLRPRTGAWRSVPPGWRMRRNARVPMSMPSCCSCLTRSKPSQCQRSSSRGRRSTNSPVRQSSLGAVEEGTFRKHLLAENGRVRDMVYFSIPNEEWPSVRSRLHARLARQRELGSAYLTSQR